MPAKDRADLRTADWKRTRAFILARDAETCAYCGGVADTVDHIIPLAVEPRLDKVIANLELMPLRMNLAKKDRMGERQYALASRFQRAGLLIRLPLK